MFCVIQWIWMCYIHSFNTNNILNIQSWTKIRTTIKRFIHKWAIHSNLMHLTWFYSYFYVTINEWIVCISTDLIYIYIFLFHHCFCLISIFLLFKSNSHRQLDLLQGIPLGLSFGSIPFLLKSKLSYSEIALFSLSAYPYSLKVKSNVIHPIQFYLFLLVILSWFGLQ